MRDPFAEGLHPLVPFNEPLDLGAALLVRLGDIRKDEITRYVFGVVRRPVAPDSETINVIVRPAEAVQHLPVFRLRLQAPLALVGVLLVVRLLLVNRQV